MSDTPADTGNIEIDVGIDRFWEQVRSAESVALLLDYDGTLAPFHVDRLKAVPLDGVVEALQELREQTDTRIAIVSGRPVAELLQLMPDPGVTIIGTHGYELRLPNQEISIVPPTGDQVALLDRAERDATRIVGRDRAERKIATVAAHFRGLDRLDAERVQQELDTRWREYADASIVEVRQFNGGLEMRALGRHKGIAVADFLRSCPGGTLAVYIGDDDTDEDAFKTLTDTGGYGIRVGSLDGSAARGSLDSCDEVLQFLHTWIRNRRNQ